MFYTQTHTHTPDFFSFSHSLNIYFEFVFSRSYAVRGQMAPSVVPPKHHFNALALGMCERACVCKYNVLFQVKTKLKRNSTKKKRREKKRDVCLCLIRRSVQRLCIVNALACVHTMNSLWVEYTYIYVYENVCFQFIRFSFGTQYLFYRSHTSPRFCLPVPNNNNNNNECPRTHHFSSSSSSSPSSSSTSSLIE